MATAKMPFTGDSTIGEILRDCPEAIEVFERHIEGFSHFHDLFNSRSVRFGAMMCNQDPQPIVDDLNRLELHL